MPSYAGIGSRETPQKVLNFMIKLGYKLAKLGYTLRSGGANGADRCFEIGCDMTQGSKEIFVPWKGFNKSKSTLTPTKIHLDKASTLHPVWYNLTPAVQKLHARNTMQILGESLDSPVEFVICWTKDGAETSDKVKRETGGTGLAIKLANRNKIRVYNLFNESSLIELKERLKGLETSIK